MKDKLAKLFCLGNYDNEKLFTDFWKQVKHCKVLTSETDTPRNKGTFLKQLRNFNQEGDKQKCLIVGVSCHGIEKEDDKPDLQFTWGSNNHHSMPVSELLEIFDGNGKTNIFLLQMCRNRSSPDTVVGEGSQNPVFLSHDAPSNPENNETLAEPSGKTWQIKQPCIKDSIVLFASPSGYKGYTNKDMPETDNNGGWLFLAMNKVLEKVRGQSLSVIDVFLQVNEQVGQMIPVGKERDRRGISSFNHMLTEDVKLTFKSSKK